MKAYEVIDRADKLVPNQYTLEEKVRWLGELEGRIYADVLLVTPRQLEQVMKDGQGQLAVGWPHDDIYLHWMLAKIHQADGELELYQNRMGNFNASYQNYVNWYIRNYDPSNREGAVFQ